MLRDTGIVGKIELECFIFRASKAFEGVLYPKCPELFVMWKARPDGDVCRLVSISSYRMLCWTEVMIVSETGC